MQHIPHLNVFHCEPWPVCTDGGSIWMQGQNTTKTGPSAACRGTEDSASSCGAARQARQGLHYSQVLHEKFPAEGHVPLEGLAHNIHWLSSGCASVGRLQSCRHHKVWIYRHHLLCNHISRLEEVSQRLRWQLCWIMLKLKRMQDSQHRTKTVGLPYLCGHVGRQHWLLICCLQSSHGPALRPHKQHLLSNLHPTRMLSMAAPQAQSFQITILCLITKPCRSPLCAVAQSSCCVAKSTTSDSQGASNEALLAS